MAENDSTTIAAAEEGQQQAKQREEKRQRSLRSAIIGSSIVLWILTIFLINIMYSVNAKLGELKQYLQINMAMFGSRSIEQYQIVDKDGNLVYRFEQVPMLYEDDLEPEPYGEPHE